MEKNSKDFHDNVDEEKQKNCVLEEDILMI
jgi:hypothetical protein